MSGSTDDDKLQLDSRPSVASYGINSVSSLGPDEEFLQ